MDKLDELETICEGVLGRKDLDKDERRYWEERLRWVTREKERNRNVVS